MLILFNYIKQIILSLTINTIHRYQSSILSVQNLKLSKEISHHPVHTPKYQRVRPVPVGKCTSQYPWIPQSVFADGTRTRSPRTLGRPPSASPRRPPCRLGTKTLRRSLRWCMSGWWWILSRHTGLGLPVCGCETLALQVKKVGRYSCLSLYLPICR